MDPTGTTAARFLVGWSARHPDATHMASGRWDDLIRPTRSPRITLRSLRSLTPGPGPAGDPGRWEAAKWFWVAQVARLRHRQDVVRDGAGRAVNGAAVFAPAFRAAVGMTGVTGDDTGPGETDTDAITTDSNARDDAARPSPDLPSRARLRRRPGAGGRAGRAGAAGAEKVRRRAKGPRRGGETRRGFAGPATRPRGGRPRRRRRRRVRSACSGRSSETGRITTSPTRPFIRPTPPAARPRPRRRCSPPGSRPTGPTSPPACSSAASSSARAGSRPGSARWRCY